MLKLSRSFIILKNKVPGGFCYEGCGTKKKKKKNKKEKEKELIISWTWFWPSLSRPPLGSLDSEWNNMNGWNEGWWSREFLGITFVVVEGGGASHPEGVWSGAAALKWGVFSICSGSLRGNGHIVLGERLSSGPPGERLGVLQEEQEHPATTTPCRWSGRKQVDGWMKGG